MTHDLTTLEDIDFLPASYRQRGMHRRAYIWRVAAALVIAGFFTATALWQRSHHAQARAKLAAIDAQHRVASGKYAELAEVTARLQAEYRTAELLTYLRHRWPHTQIMAAVLAPLPESIMLTEWHIGHDTIVSASASTIALAETKNAPKDKPAQRARDLKRLLQEGASRQHFVSLTGQAADAATLHEYLARLGTNPLFARIDLQSLEHLAAAQNTSLASGTIHFTARAILRAGHGQSASETPAAATASGPLARRGELP